MAAKADSNSGLWALVVVTLAMLVMSYVFNQLRSDLLTLIAFVVGVLLALMVAGKAMAGGK
jgi:predicted RND superfamily exporter protein